MYLLRSSSSRSVHSAPARRRRMVVCGMASTPPGPEDARPATPEYSWSVSRHDCFETCRRRYFYSYYAAAEDPEIRRLKKLSALPLWAAPSAFPV